MQSTTNSTRTFMPAQTTEKKPEKPKKERKKPTLKWLPWVVIALLVIVSGFLWFEYNQAQNKLADNSQQYYQQQTKNLGKLIILPTNETPTIVTVKDATKVRNQSFYASAKNGDITFVYAKNKRAILYRPDRNIIVNVAPVTVSQP